MQRNELFIAAEETFLNVFKQIKPDQYDMQLPNWFGSYDDTESTLRPVLNYHAYDTAWIPETFSGRTIEEVGTKYDGDLLGDDPAVSYEKYSKAATDFIRDNFDETMTVHFTYGPFPASEAILHPTGFRIFRAYDLAKLIGADVTLSEEMCKAAYEYFAPSMDMYREAGIYEAAVPVDENADFQAKLFAMVGRDPDWRV